jgi:uncharacterized protein (DUF427 family)
MSVTFGGSRIAQSDDVVLLHEPGRYPVAYLPKTDIADGSLHPTDHTSEHPELGRTNWLSVKIGGHEARRGAWEHPDLPAFAGVLSDRVAFAWLRRHKPAPEAYASVAAELGVDPGNICLIACHVWDTLGAVAAGWQAGLILREGNAPLDVGPQPTYVGDDLNDIVDRLFDRM